MLKVVVLALAMIATVSAQCGVPAIQPVSRLDAIIAHLTGKTDGRIVGGIEARAHSWPWQVALVRPGSNHFDGQFCGGSIISNNYILTAAHCVGGAASSINVLVGAHNLASSSESSARVHTVSRIIVHPSYAGGDNDFALLQLTNAITFNDQVSPVCLPGASDGPAGAKAFVTGWGSTAQRPGREQRNFPTNLRQVDQVIVDQEECKRIYAARGFPITAAEICGRAPGKDSCQGDSGGPFVAQVAGGPFKLVGVVSWGLGCADAKYPGVYSRTSTVLSWINSYTLA